MEQLTIDFEIIGLPARAIGIEVPAWVDHGITLGTIEAIEEGYCIGLDGGSGMPIAVTMAEHGDAILKYLDFHGETSVGLSHGWHMLQEQLLARAVELWASTVSVARMVPQLTDLEDHLKAYAKACADGNFDARDNAAHKFSNTWFRLKIDNSRLIINDIPLRDDADLFLQLIAICELKSIKLNTK